ncbi:hypothetical protein D3C85_907970 [compost metagenome]
MGAGRRHQQGALGGGLALDVGEVGVGRSLLHQALGLVGHERRMAGEVGGQFQQVPDRQYLQATGQAGFLGIFPGHHQGTPGGACRQCGREHALHGAQRAGEGQLAQAFDLLQGCSRQLAAGGEDAEGDGQVEAPAILRQIGGGQIEGDASWREVEAAVLDGATDSVLALFNGGFRQAHQGQGRQAVGEVRLDRHGRGFDANLRATVDYGQGHDHSLIGPPGRTGISRPTAGSAWLPARRPWLRGLRVGRGYGRARPSGCRTRHG